jgi:Rieske Fe-S protein
VEPVGGDEKPQLPAPSLWPVGFAVGIVCVLVGLVVSWPAVAIGAVITAVFGFLWVRDATTDLRGATAAPPEPPKPPPTRAPATPANEGEAGMPEPRKGEAFPRSVFLEGATLGLGGVIGGLVTLPVLGFAVLPAFLHQHTHEADLGPITDFKEGQWVIATFLRDPSLGEVSRRTAYIRNNGTLEGTPSFTILSNRCVHLGCPVQPNGPMFMNQEKISKTKNGEVRLIPSLPAGGFGCPCHGGQYDVEGNRTAGPPVRALDRYEFVVRNGRLVVGKAYSVGSVKGQGASAKIKRYPLAGPGQHVKGPEQVFYPLQPPLS